MPPDAQLRRARATTHQVSRTFGLACRLLPRAVRDDVYRLYLVFRTIDDLVDTGAPEAAERVAALIAWSEGRAQAETPETSILDAVDSRVPLPRTALRDFAAGMRTDLTHALIETDADLDRYCYQVAGTVGLMMCTVLGGDDAAHPAAVALGSAMQLTNILRDIDEDRAAGRRYLPPRAGPLMPGRRAEVLRAEIRRADELYESGLAGVAQLPRGRLAIRAAGVMYREILRQIERDGLGARAGRSHVGTRRKVWVVTRAVLDARGGHESRRSGRLHLGEVQDLR